MEEPKTLEKLPKWASSYISFFASDEGLREELEGDILDNYNWRIKKEKPVQAKFQLIRDVLLTFRFYTTNLPKISESMLITNFLKVYFRQISSDGSFSLRQLGLAVGLLSFLSIFSYYQFEHSFDSYNVDHKNIYRIERVVQQNGNDHRMNGNSYLLPKYVDLNVPEINDIAGLVNTRYEKLNFQCPVGTPRFGLTYFAVDEHFFEIFNIKFIEGNSSTALKDPGSIIITRTTRDILFNNESALGKSVLVNNASHLVQGVIEDVPANTHFDFDYLITIDKLFENPFWDKERLSTDWSYAPFIFYYIRLQDGASPVEVAEKLDAIYENQKTADDPHQSYILRPISEIHLEGHTDWELDENGDARTVQVVLILGCIVLLLTAINLTFVTIAKVAYRSGELGLRKLLGSTGFSLGNQMILENVFTLVIAFLLAMVGVYFLRIFLPSFFSIQVQFAELLSFEALTISVLVLLFMGIISSIYPIFIQLQTQPLDALKGKTLGTNKFGLLHSLVLMQVFFSVGLIASTFYFRDQIHFIMEKDPGFEVDNVGYMERFVGREVEPSYEAMKNELLTVPGVRSVTNSVQLPLRWPAGHNYELVKKGEEKGVMTSRARIGYDFFKTFEVEMAEGREFSKSFPSDTAAIIISASAAKGLGLTNPIGEVLKIFLRGGEVVEEKTVIGVVNDFNYRTLHSQLLPHYYLMGPNNPVISINFEDINNSKTLADVERVWKKFTPTEAFNLTYLRNHFLEQYKADIALGNSIEVLSIVMIILASMGIFGVSAFTSQRRVKAISIRKILGASPSGLFLLQMRFYLYLILIGFAASILPVYWWISQWLDGYAYRIQMSSINFALALISITLIVTIVAGYHTIKVALLNPINTLKNE